MKKLLIILLSALLLSGCVTYKDGKPVKDEAYEKQQKENQAKQEEKADNEKKKKEEKAKKENRPIDKKLQEDDDNVDKATLKDGKLTLVGEGKTTFSENTLFLSVYDMFETMHDAFKDKSVKEVDIELTTKMTDSKGNEAVEPVIKYNYSRKSFEELNYKNFTNMAYSEEWRILTEADYYYIHPGIYKNLKAKYKDHVSVESMK